MSLQDFSFPDGNLNPLALLEQQCLIQAIYANDVPVVEVLLANSGGGTILGSQYQPQSWPPSWVLSRQQNTLILSVAGTVNTTQWFGDVIGVYASPYPPGGCFVHSFFFQAFQAIQRQIAPFLPVDAANCGWKIAGHSYGGAVAFLYALDWLQNHAGASVQLFGSASPKALTLGYTGPIPSPYFIIQNALDIFPCAPPQHLLCALQIAYPTATFGITSDWKHYAGGVNMNSQGGWNVVGSASFEQPITPAAIGNTETAHYLTSYLQCTSLQVSTYTNTPYAQSVQAIASALIQAGPSQSQVTNPGALATVNVAQQNEQIFLSGPNGPLTNANLPTVQCGIVEVKGVTAANPIFTAATGENMALKVTFFYAVNLAGLSESFYVNTSLAPASGYTLNQATAYVAARLGISGVQTYIQWVRVSTVGSPRVVVVYSPNQLLANGLPQPNGSFVYQRPTSSGHTPTPANSDFGGTALLIRKFNPQSYSRFFLRGVPDFMIENGGTYTPTAAYTAAVNSYIAAVVAQNLTWKSTGNQQQPGSPALITGMAQNTAGGITFTLGANVFNALLAPPLQHVAVSIQGQVTPNYVNGPQTVIPATANTCNSLRPIPLTEFLAGNGRMRVNIVQTYQPIQAMIVERVVKRGPGRPFGLYRGRQRNRTQFV
jgi:Lipase (class 3)